MASRELSDIGLVPCTVDVMHSKLASVVAVAVTLVLVLAGLALLVGTLTRTPVDSSELIVNRNPDAPYQGNTETGTTDAGRTGTDGITGVPREDGAGQDATQGDTEPAVPDPSSEPSAVTPPSAPPDNREPAEFAPGSSVPADWPADVPFPENVNVGTVDLDRHVDFLLYQKSTVPLAGGKFLEALEKEKWRTTVVGTPRSSTIVARKGPASLTLLITDTADGLPAGWVTLRLIYQSEPPPEPEPTPTPTQNPLDGRA